MTLLYANKESGKTRLTAILRSLVRNDEQIIRRRLSDNATADQSVIMLGLDASARMTISFGNAGWTKTLDDMKIVETSSPNENVYSGFEISATISSFKAT